MGSCLFPIWDESPEGEKLIRAADLIKEVTDELRENVYSGESGGMQFDNSAWDGGSMAMLSLAYRLIMTEVQKPISKVKAGNMPKEAE